MYEGKLYDERYAAVNELYGKTITKITGAKEGSREIVFECSDGTIYMMYHEQECCEGVWIEDICGNVEDLLNLPLTMAEDVSNEHKYDNPPMDEDDMDEVCAWTWYKFATRKGYVTIRWCGTSNGWYSVAVSFVQLIEDEEENDD